MLEIINYPFLEIPVYRYILAVITFFIALLLRRVFNHYIMKILKRLTKKTSFKHDDLFVEAIHPPISALLLVSGFFLALTVLQIPKTILDIADFITRTHKVALSVIMVWAVYRLGDLLSFTLKNIFIENNEEIANQFADMFKQALRVMVVVIGGILIIDNLGYSVSSLLTGLGIGGLAVALAAQDTLSNFFGTIVMLTDRPFQVGDWVQFRNVDGAVETIGFRSTRVRTWAKSIMIIPNKILTSEIIQNWSVMPKRRVKMTIGITYDSSREKIQLLLEQIREVLRTDPEIDQDFILVNFTDFGPSSLNIFVYYFTKSIQWATYLKVREKINLKIMKVVEDLGLSFAFPSQTVYFGNELETKQTSDMSSEDPIND